MVWGLVIGISAFIAGYFLSTAISYFFYKTNKQKIMIVVEADTMKQMIEGQQAYQSDNVEILITDSGKQSKKEGKNGKSVGGKL